MEIIVRGVDKLETEKKLLAAGFIKAKPDKKIIVEKSGFCYTGNNFSKSLRLTRPHPKYLCTLHVEVSLGDPDADCARITGNSDLYLIALAAMEIPVSLVEKMISESK